jgi:hypothetical protein
LILDNLKVHHATLVHDWLEAHRETIEVFYLPSYSFELNPDEYLNGDSRRECTSGFLCDPRRCSFRISSAECGC